MKKILILLALLSVATPVLAESQTARDRRKVGTFDVDLVLSTETRAIVRAKWADTTHGFPSFTQADTVPVGQPVSLIGIVSGMDVVDNAADIDCYIDISDGSLKPIEVTLPDCLIGQLNGSSDSSYLLQGFSYVPEGEAGQEVRFNILVTDRLGHQWMNFDLITKLSSQ